jgi:hypothetical protein
MKKSGANPIFQYIFGLFSGVWASNTYRLYSMPHRVENWINVRILRKHKKFHVVKKTEGKSRNLAIVALWPRMGILDSVVHEIEILLKLEREVICVINKSKLSNAWIKQLEQYPITVISRENIGRDFGAYQSGVSYISSEYGLSNIESLTLANDTILFAKDSLEVIRETLNLPGDVKCIYLNLQQHLHAQSFFLVFSERVLKSTNFSNFWKSYYPSNERVHAINNGEVKLSKTLNKANFKFVSYLNSEKLHEIFADFKPFSLSELGAIFDISGATSEIRKRTYLSSDYHKLQAERILVSQNASHLLGLYLFRVMSVPLKLDLMLRGFHSSSDLYEVLRTKGYSAEALSDYESMLYKQGSWNTIRGIQVLWRKYGFI